MCSVIWHIYFYSESGYYDNNYSNIIRKTRLQLNLFYTISRSNSKKNESWKKLFEKKKIKNVLKSHFSIISNLPLSGPFKVKTNDPIITQIR